MRRHLEILGMLFIIWGVLVMLVPLAVIVYAGAGPLGAPEFLAIALVILFGLAGIIIGSALRKLQPWSRTAAIVWSIFSLFSIPFGTALGIYGLVVLLNPETRAIFSGAAGG